MALADLVSILGKHEVDFIIVGGMAAILRGTPVNTFDLDVVYERSPAPWAERLRRTFAVDVQTRARCGGRMALPSNCQPRLYDLI